MRIDVLTLFPRMVETITAESILKRAISSKKVKINIHDLRKFSSDKHKKVDDKPFGGGVGMVLMAKPIFDAVEWIKNKAGYKIEEENDVRIVLLTPQGEKLNQKLANKLSRFPELCTVRLSSKKAIFRVVNCQICFDELAKSWSPRHDACLSSNDDELSVFI